MLVELNVVEQRYRVVLEVLEDGLPVTEVAMRHGVSRQTVHTWLRRYRESGMAGLVDFSRRPPRCAHQISAEMERMVCDLRPHNPRWAVAPGPRRGTPAAPDGALCGPRCSKNVRATYEESRVPSGRGPHS